MLFDLDGFKHDNDCYGHPAGDDLLVRQGGNLARRVAGQGTAAVARRLGLSGAEVEQVRHAADLHDVGKVAIPDAILHKPGPLDDDEWAFMRRHTIIGERIVAAAPARREVATLVRASHERHDGQGYPDGLAGDDVPLGARIVAVCNSFDAMVADRPYRAALPHDAALRELERCAGTQFVAAFREAVEEPAAADLLPRAA